MVDRHIFGLYFVAKSIASYHIKRYYDYDYYDYYYYYYYYYDDDDDYYDADDDDDNSQ